MKKLTKSIPNIITLLNIACAMNSMYHSIIGNYNYSLKLMLLCVLFDFLDGISARYLNASSPLGVQLDSLADLVAFGVSPAIFCNSYSNWNSFSRFSGILLVCGAAYRLAKFNVQIDKGGFSGFPSTMNGYILPSLFYILHSYSYNIDIKAVLSIFMMSMSFLMNTSMLKIPKIYIKPHDFKFVKNITKRK